MSMSCLTSFAAIMLILGGFFFSLRAFCEMPPDGMTISCGVREVWAFMFDGTDDRFLSVEDMSDD